MSHSAVVRGTRSRFRLGSPKYRAVPVVKIDKCANGWNCPRPCEVFILAKTENPIALRTVYPKLSPHHSLHSNIILLNDWRRSTFHTASPQSRPPRLSLLLVRVRGRWSQVSTPVQVQTALPLCTKELSFPIAGAYDWCSLARSRTADSEPAGIGVYARRGIPDRRR